MYDHTEQPFTDPLVPRDFSNWWSNLVEMVRRSGAKVAAVLTIWSVVPVIGTVIFNEQQQGYVSSGPMAPGATVTPQQQDEMFQFLSDYLAFAGIWIVITILLSYLTSAGLAAAIRIVLTDAARRPISFGEAMAYGARRGLVVWGWHVIVLICVLVGICLCVLPGLYLALAFSLFAPVVVCEGGSAMARSMRLIHRAFGAMLGRVALLALFGFGLSILGGNISSAAVMLGVNSIVVTVISVIATLAVQVATMTVMSGGLLITYAETRAGEGTLSSTEQLMNEAPA
ncbi:MAG TPA: hypothetical protein H9902_04430 [Candidatus Stackebrandtia faecavium]|nr:hypothetical protein [Candidatus Stackebrandtia faecavium]